MGLSSDELIGKHISAFVPAERHYVLSELFQTLRAGKVVSEHDGKCFHKDGRRVSVSVTGFPIMHPSGEIASIGLTLRDITNRKKAEDALRESEERFRQMADGCPAIMWVTDPEGGVRFINRAARKFFGVSGEIIRGAQWKVFVHPDDATYLVEASEAAVRNRNPSGGRGAFATVDP